MDSLSSLSTVIFDNGATIANLLLVFVTCVYVYFTKKQLDATLYAIKLNSNPEIGVDFIRLYRHGDSLFPEFDVVNIGNSPAISVYLDAEIILKNTDIIGEKEIPCIGQPILIPFIRPGDKAENRDVEGRDIRGIKKILNPFGPRCIKALDEDFIKCKGKVFNEFDLIIHLPKLRIYMYYQNNADEVFKAIYEANIIKSSARDDFIVELPGYLSQIYDPRIQISKADILKDIASRLKKRFILNYEAGIDDLLEKEQSSI